MSKNTLLPKTNNREPMFSNSNAFIEYTDNVPGGFAPGSGDQNMMPTTLPADQVPDIESLDMQERTNEQAAAENHPHDSTSRKSDAVDTAPHRSPSAAFSSVIATRSSPPSCPEQAVQASPPPLSSTSNSLSECIARRSPDMETFASLTTTTTQNAQAIVEPKVNLRSDKLRLEEDDDDVEEEEEDVDDGKRNEDIPVVQPQGTETSPPLSFKNYIRNHASITDTNAITASKPLSNAGWGIPKGLGLRGGGESSLTGTSSWGTPAAGAGNATGWGAAPPGPTPPNQWGGATGPRPGPVPPPASAANAASQLTAGIEGTGSLMDLTAMPGAAKSPPAPTPVSNSPGAGGNGSSTWAQAAGKGLPPPAAGAAAGAGAPSTKQQLEQLNTMREALFSQDGWGGQHVNQDSNWDIPSSPEPGVAKDGVPVWKPNCNNGTDLWEANLRNGGQPPPAVAKTPWGHTPTSNIGGTWGEDDDAGDSSNVWTGVPAPGGPGGQGGPPPQWGGGGAGNQAPMWPGPKKGNEWGDIVGRDPVGRGGGGGGSNWGDPCNDPRAMDPRNDPRNAMDPRDMRGDPRNMMGDMRGNMDMGRGGGNVDGMMRGDPRGISGRLNGAGDGMWGGGPNQHHHNPHQGGPGKMQPVAQGVSQWSGPPPKDLGLGKPSGWEESSPPQQRRNIPNYDDGTSLWGNQPPQNARGMPGPGGGKVSHWKEMPTPGNMGRGGPGGMNCPPGMPQNRGMPASGGPMKPDGSPLWMGPPRNGSWGDGPHDGNPNQWDDSSKQGPPLGNSWPNDPQLSGNSWGGPKPQKNTGGWGDGPDMDPSAWGHQQKGPGGPPKPITKELLWSSKQFRILADLGYKKEDIEGALRSTSMDLEGAIDLLRLNSVEPWRGHGDHTPGFDHPGAGGFQGQRFNPQPMPFAPPGPGGVNNPAGLNPNNGGGNPSLANMSPANVQKLLTQVPPPQQATLGGGQPPFGAGGQRQASNQPSTAQLRMLVQQIQMAVQAGYLNHQILNQPLAPQTLLLLNQLLQQIKVLQQLMQQQTLIHQPPLKGNSNAILHISVQITKTKQQISNLQNQIASQQAIYVKQQQQQPNQPSDAFFPNQPRPDALSLQGNFEQLNMNARDPQVPAAAYQSQQSRLNQWKLPSLDKEGEGNEFSRAPGTTSKPTSANPGSNMNPLQLGQSDSTWSSVSRSSSDTGWPESVDGNPDSKDPWPVSSQQQAPAFTDLVPEFEPGKPWKGTQIKSSEDDPSITPGSVRPLSISAIKDQTEPCNKSPTSSVDTPIPPLSLSSSTWSFNPPATSGYSAPLGKPLGKNTWGEAPPPTTVTTELWGAPKSRGPPPGLAAKNNGAAASANGWGGLVGGGRSSWGGTAAPAGTWGSSWLILKNLTPQIDGSTLKTLCVQHGPLQNFHLYLNHGLALAKYNSREEANKAQGALNNCVLVNTTIFAESPADSEVHTLLQHLGHGAQPSQGGNNSAGGGAQGASWRPAAPSKADTWAQSGGGGGSQLWPPNSSSASALWGESAQEQHRATPSSLNSFLPGDLLGGESM